MGLFDKAKDIAEGLKDKAEDIANTVGDKVPDSMKDTVDDLKGKVGLGDEQGVKGAAGKVSDTARGTAGQASDAAGAAKDKLGGVARQGRWPQRTRRRTRPVT